MWWILGIVLVLALLGGLGYWMYCLFWKDIEKTAVTLFAKFKKRAIRWVNKHVEEDGKKIACKVIDWLIRELRDLKTQVQKINYVK